MACDVLIARSKGVFVSCRPKSPETFHLKYVGSAHVQIALFSLSDLMEMMQIHSNPTDNFPQGLLGAGGGIRFADQGREKCANRVC